MQKGRRQSNSKNDEFDRVEQFCRKHRIHDICDFVAKVKTEDPELARWVAGSRKGADARIRGIEARIAKVGRERRGK